MFRKRRIARRGAILLLTAAALVVLLGVAALVADVAILYVRKQAHVNGCDAAALAGARELPAFTTAEARARQAAGANGLSSTVGITVAFPSGSEIVVESAEDVRYLFAGIFGLRSTQVRARARARVSSANVIRRNYPSGLRPWGLDSTQTFSYGVEVLLKQGSRSNDGSVASPGNFYPLRLPRPGSILGGADLYKANIITGGTDVYRIGQWLETEPGNMVGPSKEGVDALIQQANQSPWSQQTWQNASEDNPRMILVPVMNWQAAGGGQTQVPVVSFAVLYLQAMSSQEVRGIFVRQFPVANAEFDPQTPVPGAGSSVRSIQLLE